MKINHVVPYKLDPFSGVYTAIAHLTGALAQTGHEVEVWELSPWPDEAGELATLVDNSGAVRRSLPASSRPWSLTSEARAMIGEGLAADVVHLHSAFSPQNNLVARLASAPMVLSPHGVYSTESLAKARLKKQVFRLLFELPTLRRVATVCALTEAEAKETADFGYGGPIEVIPNGVTAPARDLDTTALRSELGLGDEERLALFVGRIHLHHKRIDEAVRQLAASPGWHLAVIGPDYRGDEARLREVVAGLEGGRRIHLLGTRRGRRLSEAYAGADLFVLMSRYEGMPMALLEALSHGLPAIVSPGVEQTLPVAGVGAGWVSEVSQLALQLTALATAAPETWARASAGARQLAAEYQWEAIAARYGELYESLLDSVPGVPVLRSALPARSRRRDGAA